MVGSRPPWELTLDWVGARAVLLCEMALGLWFAMNSSVTLWLSSEGLILTRQKGERYCHSRQDKGS